MFKKIFLFLFIILSSINLSFAEGNAEILNSVENYLNNIKYLQANFLQDNKSTADLSEGVFYLSRPGKLRIDYNNPFEASLYTNGSITTYYDKDLDEISNIRTSSTPLHFLLKENINFNDKSFKITNVEETNTNIMVSFVETDNEEQGYLVLNFKKSPLTLSSIKLVLEDGQEIEMSLYDISNKEIKNSIFEFQNPRIKRKI